MTFALCEHALKRPRTNNLVRGRFCRIGDFRERETDILPAISLGGGKERVCFLRGG